MLMTHIVYSSCQSVTVAQGNDTASQPVWQVIQVSVALWCIFTMAMCRY